jgi:hypothetical protein
MHTVELLEAALAAARQAGYRVRDEWLGGSGGGGCEIRGQKWLFLDLALAPSDQLEQVVETLARDPDWTAANLPAALQGLLTHRRAA